MKKTLFLAVAIITLFALSSCGKYSSHYKAVAFVHSNDTSSAMMNFYSFNGRMVFKLNSTGEGDMKYSAKLGSGKATVYYDFYGIKSELFSITGGEEIEDRGGYIENGLVYIIVETDGECTNGEFSFQVK